MQNINIWNTPSSLFTIVIYDKNDEHIKYDIMTKFIRATQDGNDFIIIQDETVNYKNRDFYNKRIKHINKDKNIKWVSNNINNIIREQLENQENKLENVNNGLPMLNTTLHIIIDNYHINRNEQNIYQMLYYGIHYRINIIMFMDIDMHKNNRLPIELRSRIDYIIMFNTNDNEAKEKLYEQYTGMYNTLNEFTNDLEKYKSLIINHRTRPGLINMNRVGRFNYLPFHFII